MRIFTLILFSVLAFAVNAANINGPGSAALNVQYTYTYDAGAIVLGDVNWTVTGGTVVSSFNPNRFSGTTEYSAVITFQSSGSQTVTAKNFSGTTLATKVVSVAYPTLLPGSIGGAQTICSGGTASLLTNASSPSGGSGSYSYQWQSKKRFGSYANISGATSSTYQPGAALLTLDYRRRVLSGGQTAYSNEIAVTVVNLQAGTIGNAQTLCYNGNPSALTNVTSASGGVGAITYQWQSSTNGSSFSNISGATSTTYDPGALTSSRWYRRAAISCGITKYTPSVKVTIYSNLSAGSIGNAQTLCYNGNPAALTNTASASGSSGTKQYQWQYSTNGSSGWTDISGATSTTYDPGALTSNRWYRRRVRTSTCSEYKYTNSIKVTIHNNLSPGSIGNAQTLCYNGNPSTLTNTGSASGSSGTIQYQWESSTNGSSGWTGIPGATSATYDPGALTSSRWYRRRVRTSICSDYKYTSSVKVTIHSNLSAGSISNAQTLCYNGNPSTLTNTGSASGSSGTMQYQWQSSTNGSSGWSNISGATSTTYDPGALTSSRWYRRRVRTSTCSDYKYTGTVKVTIYNDVAAGSIGNAQTVCYNGNPSALTNTGSASGGNGSFQYQWQSSTNGSSGWTDISGATSTTYDPGALTSSRWYRRRVKATACSGYKYTSSVKVTVRSSLNAGSVGNGQTVCYAFDPAAFTSTASASGGDGNYAYQWQYYTGSTWNNVSGATSATYNPPILTATTNYRRRVISCGETKYSGTVKVTVLNELTAGSIGNAQTLCYNGNPAALTNTGSPTGGDGNYLYQWQISSNGTSGWTDVSGATGSTYDPGSLTSSKWYRRRVRSTICTDYKYTGTVKVTIYNNLTAGSINGTQTVCYNGNPSTLANVTTATGGNGHSYQWQHRSPGGSWSDISGATSGSYDPPVLTSTKEYKRRVISCGQTVYTNTITVTVRPTLNAGTVGNGQTVCYAFDPAAFTNTGSASGGDGNYAYQWQYYTGSTWNNVSGATSATYNPPILTATTNYRRRVISCGETKYSGTVKVTVLNELTSGSIGNAQTLCYNGNPTALTNAGSPTGGDANYLYQWQISSNGTSGWTDVSGATGSTYDPGALTSSKWYRRRVRSTICTDYKYTGTVKVTIYNNLTAGSIGNAQSLCYNGDPSTLTNIGSAAGGNGHSYQWQHRSPGGTWTDISGATNTTYDPGPLTSTKEYKRVVTSCGQTVNTNTITITISPSLVAGTIGGAQSVCDGDFASTLTSTSAPSGGNGSYSYQWKYYNGSSWVNAPGTSTNATYLPPSAVTATTSYKRFDTSCGQTLETNAQKVWKTDIPTAPTVSAPSSVNPGTSVTFTSGGADDQWFTSSSGGSSFHSGASYQETLNTNTTYFVEAVNYGVVNGSCESPTRTATTVTVNLVPGLTTSSPPTTCYGCFPATITAAAPQGATGSYNYQWQKLNTSNSTFEDIPAATGASYAPFKQTVGTTYRREVTSGSAVDYSDNVFIDTYPELIAGAIIGDQSLCSGEQAGILNQTTNPTGGDGNHVFEWQYGYSATGPWTPVSGGSNSNSYTPTATITQDTWYIRTVTSVGQTKESNAIKLTHRPDLVAGTIGGTQTICYDGSAALTNVSLPTNGDQTYTYQWESRPVGGSWTEVLGATLATYTAPSLTTSTEFQRKDNSCGQTAISNTITVTVNPTLVPGTIAGAQSVCEGGSATALTAATAPTGGNGSYTYQWKYYNGSAWVNAPGASTSANYTPPNAVTSTLNYKRFDTSCGQTLETNAQKVWKTDIPVAPTVTAPSAVNPGTSVTFTSGDANDEWFTAATGGSSFHTGASYQETLNTNTTYYVEAVNYGVVSGSCESTTRGSVTVTVNLIAGNITSIPTSICYGCDAPVLNAEAPQGGTGVYNYQWEELNTSTSNYDDILGATSASYNPPTLTVDATYKRRVMSGGQVAHSLPVIQPVYDQLLAGTISGDQSLCDGIQPAAFTSTTSPSGGDNTYAYTWDWGNSASGPWNQISGATGATYAEPNSIAQDKWYKRTVTSVGQSAETGTVKLTYVPPTPTGVVKGDITFCGAGMLDLSYLGGATNAIWEEKLPGGSWQAKMYNSAPMSATTNIVEPAVDGVKFRVTGGSSCGTITTPEKMITVHALFTGALQGPSQTFYGRANTSVSLSGNSGTITQWEESINNGANWTVIGNAGQSSLTLTDETATKTYRVLLNFDGACGTGYTSNFTVNVTTAGFAGYVDGPTVTDGATNSGTLVMAGSGGQTTWYSSPLGSSWTQVGTGNSYTFQNVSASTYYKAERVINGQTFTSNVHFVEFLPAIAGNISEENYVKVTSLLTEETVLANVAGTATADKLVTYSYLDGLGRGVQSVSKAVTPSDGDIISFTEIQPAGSAIARSYLPFASTGADYYTNPAAAQLAYYQAGPAGMEASSHPFAESEREASPRGLVLEQGAPGADWQLGSGHTVTHSYRFNTTNEVLKFDVDNIETTSYYAATSLNVRETTDENGNKVVVYTNARGQTVLKKVEQNATDASTANVYDIMGRLRYVFPPEAMKYIAANPSWTIATLKDNLDLIFEYTYDAEGRLIERKVPGKGLELIVYDPYERVALTQDAIMRARDQWAFTKYDKLGRTVYSGLYIDASTRAQLQTTFDALDYDANDAYYETRGTTLHGYTNTVFPTQNIEVLSVNYYDDYDFDRNNVADYALDPNHLTGQSTSTLQYTRLLPTGSKTRVLESNDWLIGVNFYDEEGRVLQSLGNNHKNLTVADKATFIYADFTSEVLETKSSIVVGSDTTEVAKKYTYDTRKRQLKTEHNLNDEGWVTLNELHYNDLGQVIEKNIGGDLQSIDYGFNIRGWLTSINRSDLSGSDNGFRKDAFGQELFYNTTDASLGNTSNFNGNISGMKWSSFAESNDVTERGYAYAYDKADRLTTADHLANDGSWSASSAFEVSGIQYDANGNIQSLSRTDADDLTVDNLSYTYTGNQLLTVADAGTGGSFDDGNTSGNDYEYDVNGNVVKDLNKGIDSIVYNHLDLPISVILSDTTQADSLQYTYDAGGSKLKMEVWKDNAVLTSTDYVGGMRYENDTLTTIAHEEGRIVIKENSQSELVSDYQYTLTDHQGNTRRVLSSLLEEYETTEDFDGINNGFADPHRHTLDTANSTLPLASNDGVGLFQAGDVGALIMFRMDKGDTIDLNVNANYEVAPSNNTFVGTAFSALFNTWDGAYGSGVEGGGISGGSETVFGNALSETEMAAKSGSSTAPRAYLNYMFFDLNMNYVTAGYEQISTSALGIGLHENIAINDIISDQAGYLITYLSNENQEAVNIHFDDFTVRHAKTNVVQAVDYYPFGAVASSYTRTAADPTKYLYNAGAELNDLTGYYETFFRNYDATIGRFNGVDIAVGKYKSQTPYNYAFNDPVLLNDPTGADPYGDSNVGDRWVWHHNYDDSDPRRSLGERYGLAGSGGLADWNSGGINHIYQGAAGDWASQLYNDIGYTSNQMFGDQLRSDALSMSHTEYGHKYGTSIVFGGALTQAARVLNDESVINDGGFLTIGMNFVGDGNGNMLDGETAEYHLYFDGSLIQDDRFTRTVAGLGNWMKFQAYRDAETDLAATGDYNGYKFFRGRLTDDQKWRSKNPVQFEVETDDRAFSEKRRVLTVGGTKMIMSLYVFSHYSKSGSLVTGFDSRDKITAFQTAGDFEPGPGFKFTNSKAAHELVLMTFGSPSMRNAFHNYFYQRHYDRMESNMQQHKRN
ncbi:MAG: DUF6443 domain-containing protein [Cyclobacteriaceae bacterium]